MLFFYVCLNIQTLVGSFSNELVERGEKRVRVVNLPPPAWSSGLLLGSSDQGLPEAASEGKSGVSGAGGQQDLCWKRMLFSSSWLPCSRSLPFAADHFPVTAVQHMVFAHVFYLLSADFSPCVIFFSLGRKLRGKAFYFVNGKVFCEEDFLVSAQLTLVLPQSCRISASMGDAQPLSLAALPAFHTALVATVSGFRAHSDVSFKLCFCCHSWR